jgi:hypothetical protein
MLHRVCQEVEMSFAPAAPTTPQPTPVHSRASSSSSRRSPSSMLYSLLSPLLANSPSPITSRVPSARLHRRQARSILVDTFRCFILPALKADLPPAYLPWSIASETTRRMKDFEGMRVEMDKILTETGMKGYKGLKRYRTFSAGSESEDDDMSNDGASSASTPATSVCSEDVSPSPQSYLFSIPPAHVIPASHQHSYTILHQRLSHLAARLASITRLSVRYEKEESRREWLEGVESGKAIDRGLRRAWSNGLVKSVSFTGPSTKSALRRVISAEDVERADLVMMVEEETSDSESMDGDSLAPLTPIDTSFASTVRLPDTPTFEDHSPSSSDDEDDLDLEKSLPSLYASSSTESLESGEWDDEVRTPSPPPVEDDCQLHQAGILPSPSRDGFNWSSQKDRPKTRVGFRRRDNELEVVFS